MNIYGKIFVWRSCILFHLSKYLIVELLGRKRLIHMFNIIRHFQHYPRVVFHLVLILISPIMNMFHVLTCHHSFLCEMSLCPFQKISVFLLSYKSLYIYIKCVANCFVFFQELLPILRFFSCFLFQLSYLHLCFKLIFLHGLKQGSRLIF